MVSRLQNRILTGRKVYLRGLEPGDLDYLYRWENEPEVWQWGDCGATSHQCDASVHQCRGDAGQSGRCDPYPLPHHGAEVAGRPGERFSRGELRKFIENQQHDILTTGQLRLVICRREFAGGDSVYDAIDNPARDTIDSPVCIAINCTTAVDISACTAKNSASSVPADPIFGTEVGFIDLFDFDPVGLSASVGILICDPVNRRKGYGDETLRLVANYAWQVLGLKELRACVAADNRASIALFSGANFVCVRDYETTTDNEYAKTGDKYAEIRSDGNKKTLDFHQELSSVFSPPE